MIKGVPQIDYTIGISSSAKFEELYVQDMSPYELRELVDSTIFDYSKIHGEKYIRDHIQHIYLGKNLYLLKATHSDKSASDLWLYKLKNQI